MRRRRMVALLALLIGIGKMIYAAGSLLETEQIYREGNAAYEDLSSRVMRGVQTDVRALGESSEPSEPSEPSTEVPPENTERVYIPDLDIDFEALKAVNEDAAAWLFCPDTAINYPVMSARDYSYYLHRLPDGTMNANGSLFIDYNCAPDFSEPLTVIYGHHMKSGRMFGGLVGYKDQGYYEKHPYMYLYAERDNYRIDLLYGCVIGAGQWRNRAFMYAENVAALLAYGAHNTTFASGAAYAEGDRVIALSTCSYEFDDARYVVIGVLRQEYEGA